MSAVQRKGVESNGTDRMEAAQSLWAVAMGFKGITPHAPILHSRITRKAVIAGMLVGLAVSFKFSHGPLAVLFPLLFVFCDGPWRARAKWVAVCALSVFVGFAVTYGYWGYQLWLQFGNPIYPFYDGYFSHWRNGTGPHP